MNLNKCFLIGRLGDDPVMRYTPSGVPVCSFPLAVGKSWISEDGQKHEVTTWFRITAWRKQAENCSAYLSKGKLVHVEGEIGNANPYTDREGNLRASLEITARNVTFLSPRDSDGSGQSRPAQRQQQEPEEPEQDWGDEDIPF